MKQVNASKFKVLKKKKTQSPWHGWRRLLRDFIIFLKQCPFYKLNFATLRTHTCKKKPPTHVYKQVIRHVTRLQPWMCVHVYRNNGSCTLVYVCSYFIHVCRLCGYEVEVSGRIADGSCKMHKIRFHTEPRRGRDVLSFVSKRTDVI